MTTATVFDFDAVLAKKEPMRSFIREMLGLLEEHPYVISFAGGLPDPDAMPAEELQKCQQLPIEQAKPGRLTGIETELDFPTSMRDALNYSPTRGKRFFVEESTKLLKELTGVEYSPKEIIATNGGQEAIFLAATALLNPGDVVYTYPATYLGYLPVLHLVGAIRKPVPINNEGVIIEEFARILQESKPINESEQTITLSKRELKLSDLEAIIQDEREKLGEIRRGKLFLLNAFSDNPNQTNLCEERAQKLVELTHKYGVVIFHDEPYGELGIANSSKLPYLNRISRELYGKDDNVLFAFTFSKVIASGYRLAVVAGPEQIISRMEAIKQAVSLCPPTISMAVIATYLRNFNLKHHIRKLRESYREKADFFEKMVKQTNNLYSLVEHYRKGPLFTWIEFREPVKGTEMFSRENIVNYGVMAVPGFFCGDLSNNSVRVNTGYPSKEQIAEGIARWDKLVKELYC